MNPSSLATAAAAALLTSACSTLQPAGDQAGSTAVDYNRAFARARDEITVLNVLRASQREPLQFSTISSVQGGLKTGASVMIPFTNLIGGGVSAVSPEVTISSRNPVVSIVPLATKEFIRGMSKPIEAQLIDDLLAQGWKKDVVLPLVVGGVVCAHREADRQDRLDDYIKINDGDDERLDDAFRQVLTGKNAFSLTRAPTLATLRLTSKDALSFIKDGVGPSHEIDSVTPIPGKDGAAQEVLVKVVVPGKVQITGLDFSSICGSPGADERVGNPSSREPADTLKEGVVLRSVLSMFRYLGQSQALTTKLERERCQGSAAHESSPVLFRIRLACDSAVPPHALVSTTFRGQTFYIAPSPEGEARDRTLETLSLLSYLVGLQTSEASLRGTNPFVTITQ
ncbi:MAG TPA: hypothetical protein VED01_08885 [Burkholderiales bacterium]|nr:hypothetical protein [Burkholderiales bacterium]